MSCTKVAIVVLNWNGKDDTTACLHSLQRIDYPSFDIIVVDNGSTDGSIATLRKRFPDVQILANARNLGYAGGNNVGIRHALNQGADAVLVLNNDTIAAPDVLKAFDAALHAEPDMGIFGGTIYQLHDENRLDHLGGQWNAERLEFDLVGKGTIACAHVPTLDYVCGAGVVIRRAVFEAIGLLEPRFFLFWEEADFCARAKSAGFGVKNCLDARIWHKGSASFVGGKPHAAYFYWRGRLLWMERHYQKRTIARLICTEGARQAKFVLLKGAEYALRRFLLRKREEREKRIRLLRYCASVCGIWHYLMRRFDGGPAWLTRVR